MRDQGQGIVNDARTPSTKAGGAGGGSGNNRISAPPGFPEDDWTNPERAIVEYLRARGHDVQPGGTTDRGRLFDAVVDGREADFKNPAPGATSATMRNRANESKRRGGQARDLIFDVRGTGMAVEEAHRGVDIRGAYLKYFDIVRVVGDGFDFTERI